MAWLITWRQTFHLHLPSRYYRYSYLSVRLCSELADGSKPERFCLLDAQLQALARVSQSQAVSIVPLPKYGKTVVCSGDLVQTAFVRTKIRPAPSVDIKPSSIHKPSRNKRLIATNNVLQRSFASWIKSASLKCDSHKKGHPIKLRTFLTQLSKII